MTTAYVYHDDFTKHDTGRGHPERPDRLRAIKKRLETTKLVEQLEPLKFEPADMKWIKRIHDDAYIERLARACKNDEPFIDAADSAICPKSADIARLAVGGVLATTDAVMKSKADNAFCAVRPPGHHAERDRSMGFCLYGNVAIAAEYLLVEHKLERVAVVDYDVHHGNGTQHIFEERDDVLFISLHQHPKTLYPGTGFEREVGRGKGEGYTLNVPLMPGGGDTVYKRAFDDKVLPKLRDYKPQALIISAGFDAAKADPLAQMTVSADGFEQMSKALIDAADDLCQGRVIACLEGGYDLDALSDGVERLVRVLLKAAK